MIQIGTADYQGTPIGAARTTLGTVYRSEPLITRDAKASLGTDPIECPDCGHPISDHHRDYQDAGCCAGGCICTLTQKDLTQEGAEQ